jgi:DNA mismatch repair protein MutL
MGSIRVMDDALATLIAAGEVVAGPSSVVKELVDNALDAGASSISVSIEEGGLRSIRVADDGAGMDEEDARLCLTRHASSKVVQPDDLWRIRTMGFRGEALAAVLAVSHMRIETRRADDDSGTLVRAAGGTIEETRPAARRPGTTIEVLNLFYNTPARRAFTDSARAEAARVVHAVVQLAVARPDVRFSLRSDDRELLDLPAVDELLDRVRQAHGAGFADTLLPLLGERGDTVVSGYVTRPSAAVKRPRRNTFLVNGRPFESPELRRVLANELAGIIPRGQHPEAIVSIDLPVGDVDVNVSPDKSTVRFRRAGQVWAALTDALRYALGEREAVAGFAAPASVRPAASPRAESAPGADAAARRLEAALAPDAPAPGPEPAAPDAARTDELPADSGYRYPQSWELTGPTPAVRERPAPEAPRHGLPENPASLLQVGNVFLVCSADDGMYVVDQHSAHERVHYERLRERYERDGRNTEVQPLLFPETLKLSPDRAALLEEMKPYLERMGFELAPAGRGEMWVHAVPAALGEAAPAPALDKLVDAYLTVRSTGVRSGDAVDGISPAEDRLLKTIACHAAIKAGKALSEKEIRALWKDLVRVDLAVHDVHGRPAALFIPVTELARRMSRAL